MNLLIIKLLQNYKQKRTFLFPLELAKLKTPKTNFRSFLTNDVKVFKMYVKLTLRRNHFEKS